MAEPKYLYPRLSLGERDRRWSAVRELLDQANLDCLVTPNNTGHQQSGHIFSPVSPPHAVDETARQHPSIAIEAQIPETLPWIADGSRISSVVRELVDNACRYSPPDLPVEVRASILDQGLVVQVTDRGER